MGPQPRPIAERLAEHIDWERPGECWICTFSKNRAHGYPRIGVLGGDGRPRLKYTHRVAHELHLGPIPPGLGVLHHCDTPACVNPDHLYAGTPADNTRDLMSRHPERVGRPQSLAREDARHVVEMYARGRWTQAELGEMWGVCRELVWQIVNRKKHFSGLGAS